MEQKILKLLIVALGFLALLVIGLALLFGFALRDVKQSIQTTEGTDKVVSAIHSLKVINGKDGADGLQGLPGKDGQNATSTIVIEQQPVKGDKGEKGDPGAPGAQTEFDGQGNWRYKGDDEWKPLFQQPVKQPTVVAE